MTSKGPLPRFFVNSMTCVNGLSEVFFMMCCPKRLVQILALRKCILCRRIINRTEKKGERKPDLKLRKTTKSFNAYLSGWVSPS